MFSASFDMRYGVRRVENESACTVLPTVAKAIPMFKGIPVVFDDKMVSYVTKTKRWRRRNRPDKVRHRTSKRYMGYLVKAGAFVGLTRDTIICHPEFRKHLGRSPLNG